MNLIEISKEMLLTKTHDLDAKQLLCMNEAGFDANIKVSIEGILSITTCKHVTAEQGEKVAIFVKESMDKLRDDLDEFMKQFGKQNHLSINMKAQSAKVGFSNEENHREFCEEHRTLLDALRKAKEGLQG